MGTMVYPFSWVLLRSFLSSVFLSSDKINLILCFNVLTNSGLIDLLLVFITLAIRVAKSFILLSFSVLSISAKIASTYLFKLIKNYDQLKGSF